MQSARVADPGQSCFTRASLYVRDLHANVNEAMLFDKFSTVGPVLSIRVCRDKTSGRSLGYAYVNYQLADDAARAMDEMNFDIFHGKPMCIMRSQRDPSLRKSEINNVYIKNLDKTIDNKAIYDTFAAFGKILSCKIAQDENGVSKCYGFIHFEDEEGANKSIEKVNGMLLLGKKVFVGKFIPRSVRDQIEPKTARRFNNVFIKNFADELNDKRLFDLFKKYGQITSHRVMKAEDGQSRGFGFVAFKEPEEAMRAIEDLNGKEISQGRLLYVGLSQSKVERQQDLNRRIARSNSSQGLNVFVKNLDLSINDSQLRQEFMQFGNITSAKVMLEDGRSEGVGFVCFSTPEEAEKAIQSMHGKILALGTKKLYVALAQRREERAAFLAAQPSHSVQPQAGHGNTRLADFTMPTPPPQYTWQQRFEGQAHPYDNRLANFTDFTMPSPPPQYTWQQRSEGQAHPYDNRLADFTVPTPPPQYTWQQCPEGQAHPYDNRLADFTVPTPPPQYTWQQRSEGQAHPSVPRFPAPYMLWGNNVCPYQQPAMSFAMGAGNGANNMQGRAIRSTMNQF